MLQIHNLIHVRPPFRQTAQLTVIAERSADARLPSAHQLSASRSAQRTFIGTRRPDQLIGSLVLRQPVDDHLIVLRTLFENQPGQVERLTERGFAGGFQNLKIKINIRTGLVALMQLNRQNIAAWLQRIQVIDNKDIIFHFAYTRR